MTDREPISDPHEPEDAEEAIATLDSETEDEFPDIEVKAHGHIDRMQAVAEKAYKQKHPGMEVRFVLAPEHTKTHSNVPSFRARGYKPVRVRELGLGESSEVYGMPDDFVRVVDTIMMACTATRKAERRIKLRGRAVEQATLSERVYKDSLERAGTVPGRGGVKAGGSLKQTTTEETVRLPDRGGE